jgi:uncharacterized protein
MNGRELTEAGKTVVRDYMKAPVDGEFDALRAFFTEGTTRTLAGDPPVSRTWTGPDEILGEFVPQMVARLIPETLEMEFTGLIAEGEKVLAEWNDHGASMSGATYDQHRLAIFTIRDGRIADVREHFDTLRAKNVLFA